MLYTLPDRLFKAKAERAADCEPTVSTIDISRLDCQAIEYFYGPRTTAVAEMDIQPDLPRLAFVSRSTPTTHFLGSHIAAHPRIGPQHTERAARPVRSPSASPPPYW